MPRLLLSLRPFKYSRFSLARSCSMIPFPPVFPPFWILFLLGFYLWFIFRPNRIPVSSSPRLGSHLPFLAFHASWYPLEEEHSGSYHDSSNENPISCSKVPLSSVYGSCRSFAGNSNGDGSGSHGILFFSFHSGLLDERVISLCEGSSILFSSFWWTSCIRLIYCQSEINLSLIYYIFLMSRFLSILWRISSISLTLSWIISVRSCSVLPLLPILEDVWGILEVLSWSHVLFSNPFHLIRNFLSFFFSFPVDVLDFVFFGIFFNMRNVCLWGRGSVMGFEDRNIDYQMNFDFLWKFKFDILRICSSFYLEQSPSSVI